MNQLPAPYKTYNGGKAAQGAYQTIINHIPPMQRYIELFVGNGGVLRHLDLPGSVIICDLDAELINKWKEIIKKHTPKGQFIVYRQSGMLTLFLHKNKPGTFIYCDPPYLFETRKDKKKKLYKYEWSEGQHKQFLKAISTATCNVMISHPDCELYSRYLKGWQKVPHQYQTRNGIIYDQLWMNYPPPVLRQDYRYLGADYREREIIQRKVSRWTKKLHALPVIQQVAILSAFMKENPAAAPLALQMQPGKPLKP